MDELLSRIYYSIQGNKRFLILFSSGIHAEVIVGEKIYLNWRTFGKIDPLKSTFFYNKHRNLFLVNTTTKQGKKSKIYFSETYPNCSSLLETNNFLTYILRKSIKENIETVLL